MSLRSPFGLLTWQKKFITAENGGDDAGVLHAVDRPPLPGTSVPPPQRVGPWETFTLVQQDTDLYAIRTASGRYWCAEGGGGGAVVANRTAVGGWELFHVVVNADGTWSLRTRDKNRYVTCETDGSITAFRTAIDVWERFVSAPPDAAVPQPPQPGTIERISAPAGSHYFTRPDGSAWRMKGVTAFKLGELWRTGGPWQEFLGAYPGYNTVWPFDYTEGPNWVDAPWDSLTIDQALRFVDDLGGLGWYCAYCLLSSSNPARRQHALDLIAAFKAANLPNLFLRGANEPEVQHDGIYIETEFMHAALADSGYPYTNGCYIDTRKHYGTWLETHTKRDAEWPRRSHDGLDIFHPPADAPAGTPAKQLPIVFGEPAKLQDVGGNRPLDWRAYFGSGSFFGAGATFHSQTGKFCDLPTADEQRLAAEALVGMNAFPETAPAGPYTRVDDSTLRTYIVGNASVRIRPTTPTHPQAGWTKIDADGILWKR